MSNDLNKPVLQVPIMKDRALHTFLMDLRSTVEAMRKQLNKIIEENNLKVK